jgi:peptidoglycan/xylan/chitin deacetylase (PgdA/CDA1 family)
MKTHTTGGLILLYHRVAILDRDPQLLCVSPQNFERHLEVLHDRLDVVPLCEIASDVAAGRSPDGKVAITFDDGYADNTLAAAPILARHHAPATFFLTTAHTYACNEFFWDDLDRIFLSPGELPRRLKLWLPDRPYEIDLGESATYSDAHAHLHRHWTVLEKSDPTPRHRAYRELCALLHNSTVARRRQVLEQLQAWSGIPKRDTHRMMSVDELRQLARNSVFEIAGHTVDHPKLSIETAETQRSQIQENKRTLEWIIRRPLTAFSYPFGTRRDFANETISAVRAVGCHIACANFEDRVTSGSNALALPRTVVRDWTTLEFERALSRWMDLPITKAA